MTHPAPAGDRKLGDTAVRPRRPIFGTILWGVLLLVFAGTMAARSLLPTPVDPGLWLVGTVLAAGLVLVVTGIAAAVRRSG